MDDIIASIPWSCAFDDGCAAGWHLANYWSNEDGTYTIDSYGDGDHETIEESDLPTAQAETQAWKEYQQYVAREGKDPLGEFSVKTSRSAVQHWQARFRNWIGSSENGLIFVGAKRRGQKTWIRGSDLPVPVRDYLALQRQPGANGVWTIPDFKTEKAFLENTENAQRRNAEIWINFEVEVSTPRSEKRTIQELKTAARKSLKANA